MQLQVLGHTADPRQPLRFHLRPLAGLPYWSSPEGLSVAISPGCSSEADSEWDPFCRLPYGSSSPAATEAVSEAAQESQQAQHGSQQAQHGSQQAQHSSQQAQHGSGKLDAWARFQQQRKEQHPVVDLNADTDADEVCQEVHPRAGQARKQAQPVRRAAAPGASSAKACSAKPVLDLQADSSLHADADAGEPSSIVGAVCSSSNLQHSLSGMLNSCIAHDTLRRHSHGASYTLHQVLGSGDRLGTSYFEAILHAAYVTQVCGCGAGAQADSDDLLQDTSWLKPAGQIAPQSAQVHVLE